MRIIYVPGSGLLGSDSFGRVHLFDDDLNLLRSSPQVRSSRPLYGLAVSGEYVLGKDRMGAIFRWSLASLDLLNRLDPASICDQSRLLPGEEPSPNSSRGIAVWDGRVHVTSGFHDQMLVIDLETFQVLDIVPNICGSAVMEWASTDHPTTHVVSDKRGSLWFGHFDDLSFPKQVKLDEGNVHRVVYDKRHDRFWCTQDFGEGEAADIANGVVTVSVDGEKQGEFLFARDDVEFVLFNSDYTKAFAGGFDGDLMVFDNTSRDLVVHSVLQGFSHQLSDITASPDDTLFVLTQDGEVVKLNEHGEVTGSLNFRRQAIWDIQATPDEPDELWLATDSGVSTARVVQSLVGPTLELSERFRSPYGFTRRVAPVQGGCVGIGRASVIFAISGSGEERWAVRRDGLLHTVATSPDGKRVLVAGNEGATELMAADGSIVAELQLEGLPIWASAYMPDGRRVLCTRNGVLAILDDDGRIAWRHDLGEYPKRMWTTAADVYVVGDGGLKELRVGQGETRRWFEIISNTAENAVIFDGKVFVSSYGMQIAAYTTDDDFIGLLEDFPDYPKALWVLRGAKGEPFLLVGGRSGILSTYRADLPAELGTLAKHEDRWLPLSVVRHEIHHTSAVLS